MLKAKKNLLLFAFISLGINLCNAQIVNSKGFDIYGGIIDYSSKYLNNTSSENKSFSFASGVEYSFPTNKYLSPYLNLSAGHLKNMGQNYQDEIGKDFFRFGFGLILNPNNGVFFLSQHKKNFEPYGKFGYSFEFIDKNLLGVLNTGLGFWIPILNDINIGYNYTYNYRLAQDYRTFAQHNIGLRVTFDFFE